MEEIDLSGKDDIIEFVDEEQFAIKKVNLQFRQENKLKGIQRDFTIFNDIQFQVVEKKKRSSQKFRVALNYLNPEPKHHVTFAKGWLITTLISAVFSSLLVYVGWFSNIQVSQSTVSIISALSISFSLIAFFITVLRSNDYIILHSRHGNVPILEFINKNPDSKAFKKFMKSLRNHIMYAQKQAQYSATDQLKLELKELRRLKDEKVIPEESYEVAKKRIFKNKAFK